jgi:hypothetical protein
MTNEIMLKLLRKVLFFFLLFAAMSLGAQEAVTINEYGTWIVESGRIKKIPSGEQLGQVSFWEDYAVFDLAAKKGFIIYNISTGAVSEWFDSGYRSVPVPVKRGRRLFFIIDCREYELDPLTLKTLGKKEVPEQPVFRWPWLVTSSRKIGKRVIRYSGKNFYIDVTYGPIPDLFGKYEDKYFVTGGTDNLFVIVVEPSNKIAESSFIYW